MKVWDWVARRLKWRWLPERIPINKEMHQRHLVMVTATHPDGRPRDLRIVGNEDVIDCTGEEQFGTIYLRVEGEHGKESQGGREGGRQ